MCLHDQRHCGAGCSHAMPGLGNAKDPGNRTNRSHRARPSRPRAPRAKRSGVVAGARVGSTGAVRVGADSHRTVIATPHVSQNLWPTGFSVEHEAQTALSRSLRPQSPQNLARDKFSYLHHGNVIGVKGGHQEPCMRLNAKVQSSLGQRRTGHCQVDRYVEGASTDDSQDPVKGHCRPNLPPSSL